MVAIPAIFRRQGKSRYSEVLFRQTHHVHESYFNIFTAGSVSANEMCAQRITILNNLEKQILKCI
jgi:hypothetical protein